MNWTISNKLLLALSSHPDLQFEWKSYTFPFLCPTPGECTFTFMHLADAFIDLQYIQVIHLYCQYVCSLGIEPTTFCAAEAMLYHWATGTLVIAAVHIST